MEEVAMNCHLKITRNNYMSYNFFENTIDNTSKM